MTQDLFQVVIRAYLDARAKADEQFNAKYSNPKKSLEECANYIYNQVRKSGRCGFDDAEIFGMAVHYYDEAELAAEDLKPVSGVQTIINTKIEKPQQEKPQVSKPKKAAVKPFVPTIKPTAKPTPEKPTEPKQMSLF